MDRRVFVHLDYGGFRGAVGRLWLRTRRRRESASFLYEPEWLAHSGRFEIEPALDLRRAAFHTGQEQEVFGVFSDAAPDRWGRRLLQRAEALRAALAGETPRRLTEVDYLLGCDDETRQGAVRFTEGPDEPFLAPPGPSRIPPLVELPRLLGAAERVESGDDDGGRDLAVLLAPGSSLGGARPKASVREPDGALAIAKFPQAADEWEVTRWEAVALSLAERAGIRAARFRVERADGRAVLVLRRFDRDSGRRIPFLSAMTLLGAVEHDRRAYTEIAEAVRRYGAEPAADLAELWRRIVFTVLISNHDDHLRNHGFLRAPGGWRLSPAYDLNPTPAEAGGRFLTTAIVGDDARASLELAFGTAAYYGLGPRRAREVAAEAASAAGGWREEAVRFGLSRGEQDRLASAFEHGERERATAARVTA